MAASHIETHRRKQCFAGHRSVGLFVLLVLCLVACSNSPIAPDTTATLAPLQTPAGPVTVDQVAGIAPTPDLLALDDEMREFVARYTAGVKSGRQRLKMLHGALIGAGSHDLQYDPFADGTAQEAFHRGSANCLSYASLFIALAREADLDASYQWLEIKPEWSLIGERVAVRLHVNTRIDLGRHAQYMVDLDPVASRDVANTDWLSDQDGLALYHNNLAMDALSQEELTAAWAHSVQAIRLSPEMPHLWVNLGAIYRASGQHREAEASYRQALELDHTDRSAMNNLAVLYGLEGREGDRDYWLDQVERYRQANPYFHAWQGDIAGKAGDWREALRHYEKALRLLPEDSHLLYAKGNIHYELNDLEEASRLLKEAIDNAPRVSDREAYQVRLDAVRQEALAGI